MTVVNGYTTLAKFKTLYNVQGDDNPRDVEIEATISAVSRLIDSHCHRRFYTTTADETRYYTAQDEDEFYCPDDIISITTLATDINGDRSYASTWSATDYDLMPDNAALDGRPYTQIVLTPNGRYTFPDWRRGVKIVGKFGYATVPDLVERACLIQSFRLWTQKAAPFGITGGMEKAVTASGMDEDIELMLSKVMRL